MVPTPEAISPLVEKVGTLWPELMMLVGATVCMLMGLSRNADARRSTPWIAAATLVIAALLVPANLTPYSNGVGLGGMIPFVKLATLAVGLVLLMVAAHVPEGLRLVRQAEAAPRFEPANVVRGEFYAFFLFSLTGVMLTASADDLVWLFLALELTSLPTYVMVAIARDRIDAQESAVKYFFLGALSAAVFLYGFTLIYGATGFTDFASIRASVLDQLELTGSFSPLLITGLLLSVLGICFKIAAVPMHFYAADVYEGAATPVTAFLAFVPKTAGFVALILLFALVGWEHGAGGDALPTLLAELVAWIAVLTMTVGNVLGLVQRNVKRVLAYSSIAHSGYVLVGLLAGPALFEAGAASNGLAAILFYLVAYALGTIGSFAVLGCLEARGEEAQTYDDISGLVRRHPALAGIMLVSVLSLLGFPFTVGLLGKIYLVGSTWTAGYGWVVIALVLNSAISAGYYLHIALVCIIGEPNDDVTAAPVPGRRLGAAVAAIGAVVLGVAGGRLVDSAHHATATPTRAASLDAPAPTDGPLISAPDLDNASIPDRDF